VQRHRDHRASRVRPIGAAGSCAECGFERNRLHGKEKLLIRLRSPPIVSSIADLDLGRSKKIGNIPKHFKPLSSEQERAAKAMTIDNWAIDQRAIEHWANAARGVLGTANSNSKSEAMETLASLLYDDVTVTEVIRPAAVLCEDSARAVLEELRIQDVRQGGNWHTEPGCWRLYERPWAGHHETADDQAALIGSIQVAYGIPRRYEITIFRATITVAGSRCGYTVTSLCDEALAFAGLSLAACLRIDLPAPPKPFHMR
jgi:hypothetical protein